MTNLHRILVPVDFSETSAEAAQYAAALNVEGRGELRLLHVLPESPIDFSLLDPLEWRRQELLAGRSGEALKRLESFRERLPASLDVKLEVVEGDAAEQIVRCAQEPNVDAVVMPTRGRTRIERLLLIGSVTMKVLHALEKPVITGIRFEDHLPPQAVRRVLCAVDLGPASERVLCAALQMSKRYDAKLSVVHAQPVFGHANQEIYDDAWRETVQGRTRQKLQELTERLGAEADLHVELDQPPRAISGLALKLGANLVVLGRGESDDIIGRLRADAYDIIRMCHCPVASV